VARAAATRLKWPLDTIDRCTKQEICYLLSDTQSRDYDGRPSTILNPPTIRCAADWEAFLAGINDDE